MNITFENSLELFKSDMWTKQMTSLRRRLRKKAIHVSIKNEKERFVQKLHFTRFEPDMNVIDATINLSYTEEKVLDLDAYGTSSSENESFYDVYNTIKSAATECGLELIIVSNTNFYGTPFPAHFDLFRNASDYPGENYPSSLIGSYNIYSGTPEKEHCFYIPLTEGLIERRVAILDAFRQETKRHQENDITFLVKENYTNSLWTGIHFYYEGFSGKIRVHYGQTITVTLHDGGDWHKDEILKTEVTTDAHKIAGIMRGFIAYAINLIALPKLLNPPKEHFKAYFRKHFPIDAPSIEVYKLLEQQMDAKDIEVAVLSSTYKPIHYSDYTRKTYLISMLSRYFVGSSTTNEHYMVEELADALQQFDALSQKFERIKYEKGLSDAKIKVQEAFQHFEQ